MKTVLYDLHLKLGAKMTEFSGWEMPVQYAGIVPEHLQVRQRAGVFDTCHMGVFTAKGEEVGEWLDAVLTSNPSSLKDFRCRYGFLLSPDGGVLDDVIAFKRSENDYFIVVNAGTLQDDFDHMKSTLGGRNIEFKNISDTTGKIDLQGPASFEVLERVTGKDFSDLKYFGFRDDSDWTISRTGYTGELGVEIYLPAEKAGELFERLVEDPEVEPAGLGARDTLRLECGLPLYGHELSEDLSPLAFAEGRFLRWDCDYIGRAVLERQKAAGGPPEVIVGLKTESRSAPRAGESVLVEGAKAGVVTSGSFAPSLGYSIAFAKMDKDSLETLKKAGAEIDKGRRKLPAAFEEAPFYKGGSARKKLG